MAIPILFQYVMYIEKINFVKLFCISQRAMTFFKQKITPVMTHGLKLINRKNVEITECNFFNKRGWCAH
jgi:hypothetical protein